MKRTRSQEDEGGGEVRQEEKGKSQKLANPLNDPSLAQGYTFVEDNTHDLSIKEIPTTKDLIEQPELAKDEKIYIPRRGFSCIVSGKSGSGKSTLLTNWFTDPRFYGPSPERPNGWFDKVFLFSPTAGGDDVQKALNIPKNHVFTDLEEAPELLEVILDSQSQKIENGDGAHTVEQFAVIFDDVIGDVEFMNSKEFTACFYRVRHANLTTFICTQHFNRVPRICRLQANFVVFFQGSQSEVETIVEEFAPPCYTKNEFRQLVTDATSKTRFDFLTICMKVGWEHRFRRNLNEFITLDRICEEEEPDKDQDSDTSDEDEGDDACDEGDDIDPEYLEKYGKENEDKPILEQEPWLI